MCFLVAIDLSAPSRSAIEMSALLARATGLSPLLLHVSAGRPPLQLLADLYTLAEPLRELGSAPRLRTVQGEPAPRICEQAMIRGARFVVMGTRGHHLQATGSVARSVMASCLIPVIAVRPQTLMSSATPLPGGRPVALMDAAEPGEAARTIARFLVEATQGRLVELPPDQTWRARLTAQGSPLPNPAHLVVAVDPTTPTPPWIERMLHEEATPMVLVSQRSGVPFHTATG